jgi:hypothetical protein
MHESVTIAFMGSISFDASLSKISSSMFRIFGMDEAPPTKNISEISSGFVFVFLRS